MIYGERVRQVREMHRLTQKELATDRLHIPQYQLSRIESGAVQPSEEVLGLLAVNSGVTPGFFERPPVDGIEPHSPQFRARSRLTTAAKSAALRWAHLVHEQYANLQELAQRIPVGIETMHGTPPAVAAQRMRPLLGFGPLEPLPYLVLAVERLGVTVLGLPYEDDALDAFCAWHHDEPVICLFRNVSGDRIRFTLAHELGHLVLHERGQAGRDVEAEADAFAAELLTPFGAMGRVMPNNPTLRSFSMLKTHWGVSVKSLVRRARELGYIDQERATGLYRQMSARGWTRTEPGHVPIEKPRAFRKLVEIAFGPGSNVALLAKEAGWSEELSLQVLQRHATLEELPFDFGGGRGPAGGDNVVQFRRRRT
jgi:Zn-dependent peptidase ImmA (M78 family)/DNA-binding XRE family transcriptional regulator